MEVILIDDVYQLGRRGDVVRVADGYGRNYLIPKGMAVLANAGNLRMIEQQRASMARKEAKYRDEAELLAGELGQLHILISRKAGETGVLFGSVTAKDISAALAASGINLDRRRILLDHPIKAIGNVSLEARPHNDVQVQLLISVLPEGDEPVSKAIHRGVDSDKILSDLDAKVGDLRRRRGGAAEATQTEPAQRPEEGTESEPGGSEAAASAISEASEGESSGSAS